MFIEKVILSMLMVVTVAGAVLLDVKVRRRKWDMVDSLLTGFAVLGVVGIWIH